MVLNKWNSWWATKKVEKDALGIQRDKNSYMQTKHIKDIIGIRRSGKTTYVMQIINNLLNNHVDPHKIVFINFDDPQIKNLNFEQIDNLIFTTKPEVKYLFVDEIQEKNGWENWIRTNYDLKRFKQIFVTGSTCSLISKDIGKTLTGRHITINFMPFSFLEYVQYHLNQELNKDIIKYNKYKIINLFKKYMLEGGFPETFEKSETTRNLIINNIYKDILSRDIAARYNIDYEKLENISNYLMSNIKNEYSYRSIANKLGIAFETIEKYIEYLKDSFLFYDLKIFDYKFANQYKKNKKIYVVDIGLFTSVSFKFSEDKGRILENLVFIELKRRNKEIYYHKQKKECDFVIKTGLDIVQAIQVTDNINNSNTKKREIDGLLDACKSYNLKEGLILTEDEEYELTQDNIKITIKPIWKWLLN